MLSKIIFVLAAVCVIKAAVLVNERKGDPEAVLLSEKSDYNDNSLNVEEPSFSADAWDEQGILRTNEDLMVSSARTCLFWVCNEHCRRLGNLGGRCLSNTICACF
ncbi:hypothetical protein B5X24_HaOG207751 [Helicoverpa armigera]|nr:hypothetical protein B5X24_HaOG207751 [Helicoverpa armigera]